MPESQSIAEKFGSKVYLPKSDALRPGDIILTRNKNAESAVDIKTSSTVAKISKGSFSHAMIVSHAPTVVEAMPAGVGVFSLHRSLVHQIENVRVLRYADAEIALKAAKRTQSEVGRTYCKRKAIASIFPERIIDEISHRGIFCSALVAQVFAEAGAPEFKALNINKVTPGTLEHLEFLEDVTDEIFYEALPPANAEALSALDGDRVASPSNKQTALTLDYAKELIPFSDKIVGDYPELGLTAPSTFYKSIEFVMDAINATDQVPPADRDAYVEAIASFDELLAEILDRGELRAVAEEMISLEAAENQRMLEESFKAEPDIDIPSLRSSIKFTEGQIAARQTSLDSFINWGEGTSGAVDRWIEFNRLMVKPYEYRLQLSREVLQRIT